MIERRRGTSIQAPKKKPKPQSENYEDEDEPVRPVLEIKDSVDTNGQLLNQLPAYDWLLNAEVQMQLDNEHAMGKVKRRAVGPDGKTSRKYDDNPFLNSITYKVKFSDGQVREYSSNLIAENVLTQVDSDSYSMALMEGIIDYTKDDSITVQEQDKYITVESGQRRLR